MEEVAEESSNRLNFHKIIEIKSIGNEYTEIEPDCKREGNLLGGELICNMRTGTNEGEIIYLGSSYVDLLLM